MPATRVAYNFASGWVLAAEYADFGRFGDWASPQQAHQLYGVFDKTFGSIDVEAGIGVGLTDASDRLTLKLIVAHDFNQRPKRFSR